MPKGALPAAVFAMLVVACGAASTEDRASKAAQEAKDPTGLFNIVPSKPASMPCKIPAGGVTSHFVPGTCQTSVGLRKDGSAVVRFIETWGNGAVSHTWRVVVSKSGRIVAQSEYGETPPQNAV